ncbi:hypothetical protein HMPREF0988_02087 [Lachnospiraceae bacterium 1_4_56FAA]|nr:hypothetical protein HMPREF0988_02087 [Lachnospiraceae bacterium 1_4_56FAA]
MRRGKQAAGVLLCMVLAAASVPGIPANAEEGKTKDVKTEAVQTKEPVQSLSSVNGQATIPQIRLSVGDGQSTPQYAAEEQVELVVKVTNQGVADAQNVRITPMIDNAADWPFVIESMNYEQNLGTIKAGERVEAKWALTVRSDVETKSYKSLFAISYDDGKTPYDVQKTIYVNTTAKPAEQPGGGDGGSVQDPNTNPNTDPQTPGETPGGDAGSDSGDLSGMGGAMIPGDGGVYNSDPVVSGGGSTSKSVPRVIVTGFATDPGAVNAGSNFRLTVHVKNTSSATAVSNMLFDLQAPAAGTEGAAEAPAFLPASGSSSIYLDSIPAGETRDITIDMNARADLLQKPYSIALTMKYEDGNAVQYEGASSLAIPVQQAARFEFSDIEIAPGSVEVGEEANLTCSLYNTGRVKLYNVKASFVGDGIKGKDVFVGNLESGATGTIDGMLTAESEIPAGTKCKMVVTYEDVSGNVSTTEKEFELEVLPMAADDMPADAATVEQKASIPVVPIVIGVLVVAGVVLTIVLLRRKRKNRCWQKRRIWQMRWIDLLRMSSGSLKRRKLRTFLTVLGVVIGTASIVVMISLGLGMQQSLYREIEQSGGMTSITVTGKDVGSRMVYTSDDQMGDETKKYITDETIKELEKLEHVASASPSLTMNSVLLSGKYEGYIQLVGLTPEEMKRQNMKLTDDSRLPDEDAQNLELIFGNGVPTMFYERGSGKGYWETMELPDIDFRNDQMFLILDQDAFFNAQQNTPVSENSGDQSAQSGGNASAGTQKPPKKYVVNACGMVAGDVESYNANYYDVYCNIDVLRSMLQKEFAGRAIPGQPTTKTGKPYRFFAYTTAKVQADELDNVETLANQIRELGYNVSTNAEYLKSMQKQFAMVQALLGGIGAVSLFVAAIGIANTMMMSIYERTKEIGVIKVLGCSLRNIKTMFLMEAGFIGFIGGVIGNILSFLMSVAINFLVAKSGGVGLDGNLSYIPLWLVLASMGFAVFVGMAAGYFPALRAMRLSPLAAIRNN